MNPGAAWGWTIAGFAAVFVWLIIIEELRKRAKPRTAPPIIVTQRPLTTREVAAFRRDWHGAQRTRAMPRRNPVPPYRTRGHR